MSEQRGSTQESTQSSTASQQEASGRVIQREKSQNSAEAVAGNARPRQTARERQDNRRATMRTSDKKVISPLRGVITFIEPDRICAAVLHESSGYIGCTEYQTRILWQRLRSRAPCDTQQRAGHFNHVARLQPLPPPCPRGIHSRRRKQAAIVYFCSVRIDRNGHIQAGAKVRSETQIGIGRCPDFESWLINGHTLTTMQTG